MAGAIMGREQAPTELLIASGAVTADRAIELLSKNDFIFNVMPVIALELENRPGELANISSKFGEEGININYVYGSVSSLDEKCLFVFCPEDIELASKIFEK